MTHIKFSTLLFFLLLGSSSFSQNGIIKGSLADKADQKVLAGATVTLQSLTTKQLLNTISDNNGLFSLTIAVPDSFQLNISMIGYETYQRKIRAGNRDRDLGTITLNKQQGKELAGVTVVATAPPVVQKGDTSQFSAGQYKVNPDASTEDLIKKMPGITVDKNGTVTAQGEQVRKVTVDGKDFFGDDATAALKNLPAEVVDKIQVFDRLSDQAQLTGVDDGNSQKSINIVTKTGIRNGQFGRAFAGYGTDERYTTGGNISFFKGDRRLSVVANFNNINQQNFGSQDLLGISSNSNTRNFGGGGGGRGGGMGGMGGGENFTVGQANGISETNALGLNYSDKWGKKWIVSGSYFFNNSKNTNRATSNTELLDNNQFTFQNSNSVTRNTNHRINARFEFKPDSNNTFFIIPSLSFQNNKSNTLSTQQSYKEIADSINNSIARTDADRNGYNLRNNLLYRHSFPKKGRSLSMGFNTIFTQNDGESIINGYYRFYDINSQPILPDSLQQQFTDNNNNGYTLEGNVTYTEPLSKVTSLQFDYSPSYQFNKANQQTFLYDGQKYSTLDTSLSNKFDNSITTQRAGITFRLNPSKDEQLAFGINFQTAMLESERVFPSVGNVNQSFSNFLPNAFWRKKFSNVSNMRIFYRASTNFPSITQLQDVVNLNNPLRVSSGNPLLKQSYTHFLGGRYTYTNSKTSKSFFANLFLQTAADYISNATYIAQQDSVIQNGIILRRGSQLSKPVNLDGYHNIRSFLTYSMPVKKLKTTINLNAGFIYSRLPGIVNNLATVTNNYQYNTGVVLASNISQYVDFNISYAINFNNAKTIGGNFAENKYSNQTVGMVLNLLNKKGWFIQNDISNQYYNGLSGDLDQSYTLWNASIGKKFGKKKAAELKLSAFDLLKENQSISRTVTNTYIEDVQSVVLQQYFMVIFTYNLKNFGKGRTAAPARETEENMPMRPRGTYPGF